MAGKWSRFSVGKQELEEAERDAVFHSFFTPLRVDFQEGAKTQWY
jgi:hypothetical protein